MIPIDIAAAANKAGGNVAFQTGNAFLLQAKREYKEKHGKEEAQKYSGFFQGDILGPVPRYNLKESEKLFDGKHNTYIILGRDRPSSDDTGNGAIPATNVGCIDIIAGLSGPLARETDAEGEEVATDKNPTLDAARIYISQRAKDIDSPEYFNIAAGQVGSPTNRSAIAIKADSVRLIGREGIKLVTSGDNYNGSGGLFIGNNIQGVDIIAGNNDATLEPMVKGDTLAIAFDRTLDIITNVHGSVAVTLELLVKLLSALSPVLGSGTAPLLARAAIETENLKRQEKGFVYHYLNYKDTNPIAAYNFRSRHNNVN